MSTLNFLEVLKLLMTSQNATYHFSLKTAYSLIIKAHADGSIDVNAANDSPILAMSNLSDSPSNYTLTDPTPDSTPTNPELNSTEPGYQYYIWPDYQTSFAFHVSGWAGNPVEVGNVEDDELESRYSPSWCAALEAWVDRYTRGFEAQECHFGSEKEPLPGAAERTAWLLEGMLLACWLALQAGVDAVEYIPEQKSYRVE